VGLVATLAVSAFLLAFFGFQLVRVDGISMTPTLADSDQLVVDRLVYRLGDPRPGDVVTLYYPANPGTVFVKRVIAKEGDVVQIVEGRVLVNDRPLRDDYVVAQYRDHGNWGPQAIPQGFDFVMGDHRTISFDSRYWGFVPKRYIVGKVMLRWWPLHDVKVF
jgi:signal peptidase I